MDPTVSDRMTTKQLAEALCIEPSAFHNFLPKATAYGIISRSSRRKLNKQTRDASYKYRITKYGIKMYLQYRARIARGQSLNRKHLPIPVDHYLFVTASEDEDLDAALTRRDQIEKVLIGDIRKSPKNQTEDHSTIEC
jgi:hypothetical protein